MHETFENFSFGSDFQSVAAHGRLDSGGLDRYPDRRSAAAFVGMEIDRRQPPVWPESPSGGGLGGVFAQRVQRRTQTPSSTQLAQATGLCLEASGPPLHPSQQQGS